MTPAGSEAAFHGVYREIVQNERLGYTEVLEGMPDAEAITTITFAETGGRTIARILVEHASREHRDAHPASGMGPGMQEVLEPLEQTAKAVARSAGLTFPPPRASFR